MPPSSLTRGRGAALPSMTALVLRLLAASAPDLCPVNRPTFRLVLRCCLQMSCSVRDLHLQRLNRRPYGLHGHLEVGHRLSTVTVLLQQPIGLRRVSDGRIRAGHRVDHPRPILFSRLGFGQIGRERRRYTAGR